MVMPLVLPRAPVMFAVRVPPEIRVAPLKVLAWERVWLPLPVLVRPPVPLIVPLKSVEVLAPPVARVKPAFASVPAPASEPMFSVPPRVRVVPAESVMDGVPVRRLAEPKVVVPAVTFTTVAAEVTDSVRVALRFNVPVPRLTLRVPLFRSYVDAVRVPVPARVPPASVSEPTVSLPPRDSVPLLMAKVAAEFRRPAEPRVVVPVVTVSAPAPSWALTVPPVRA